jgi:alpha-1,2-mannosyltransferase
VGLVKPADHVRPTLGFPPGAGLASGLVVFALAVAPLLILKFHSGKFPLDLAVYREAGRVVLHGGDPYAPAFGRNLRVPLPFTYPPFAALASVPIALLSSAASIVAWTTMSLGLLLAMAWLAAQPALVAAARRGSAIRWRVLGPLLGLGSGVLAWTIPLTQTIAFGQVNLPLALGCCVDCLWTSRRRGVLVGIATAVKLTPGVFILYFAVTRQWAAAMRAAIAAAVCELLAIVLLPRPSREYWLHLVFAPTRAGNPGYFTNQSLFGVITRFHLAAWLWPVAALAVAALGLWRAALAHRRGQELVAVALVGLTGLAVSPISWQHHAVWIVLVIGVLAAWAATAPSPARIATALGVLVLFVLPFPLFGHQLLSVGLAPAFARVLENSYVLAYLALLLTLPLPHDEPAQQAATDLVGPQSHR